MQPIIFESEVPDDLRKHGVSRIAKENSSYLMVCNDKPIIFEFQRTWFKTVEGFEKAAKDKKIDQTTLQAIVLYLVQNSSTDLLLNDDVSLRQDNDNNKIEKNTGELTKSTSCYAPPDIILKESMYEGAATKGEISAAIDPSKELDPFIPDRDYTEFVIRTIKRTVKQEDSLVRQIFYTGLSKDSANPINLAVLAPTSEGKTHPVLEGVQYFPKKDVWKVGSMTPRVLIRQNGTLVDSNNEPLEGRIKELKREISSTEGDDNNREELREQLGQLYEEAKVLIDLRGKVLVFLEPPHHQTWTILKPILSHDDFEMEHPYVYDMPGMGFKVKKVVTRGWPACIFCSAKNESNWPEWPEIASRFLISSPNMTSKKYLEGNRLIAQRMGLPMLLQQALIVSDNDVELSKKCVLYLIQQIKKFSSPRNSSNTKNNNNSTWVPFGSTLAEILPSEKGTDNRFTQRMFSLLRMITLSRAHLRSRLEYGNESLVIANIEEDLHEVLHITQNISGIPPYKLKIFKDVFIPLYKSKKYPDKNIKDNGKEEEEKIIAVTTKELCDYYKKQTGKIITTNNMKQNYLNEFINNGLIDEADSVLDKRSKIYYPLIDPATTATITDQVELRETAYDDKLEDSLKISKLSNSDRMDNILQHSKLIVPKNYTCIPYNWLEVAILSLVKYPTSLSKFELYNEQNERICICKFIKNYEKTIEFNGYFSKPIFCNYHSTLFGSMHYLGEFNDEEYKKLSIDSQMDNFSISDTGKASVAVNNGQQTILTNIQNQVCSSATYPTAPPTLGHTNGPYADDRVLRIEGQNNNEQKLFEHGSSCQIKLEPVVSIEEFFYDLPDLPYTPLPEHSLKESPCYPIISKKGKFYYCKVHPSIESIYLDTIEQHCKYKEPDVHKSEILKLLSQLNTANFGEGKT